MEEKAVPRLTARDIILAITDNLHEGVEPMLYRALVPSLYHVYLHFDDYRRLEGIFPKIIEEARQALDQELEQMNEGAELPWILKRLPLAGKQSMKFERGERDWFISFHQNTDDDAHKGDIIVDSQFTLPVTHEYGAGSKTKRIVTLHSGGASKLLRTSYEESEAAGETSRATERIRHPLANIRYRDTQGDQSYPMTKTQIVIGRGGVGYWVDLKLEAPPDVSREHLRIRHDESSRQFFIKDLSTFGTSIDGRRIPSSVQAANGDKQDKEVWVPLPQKAKIGLADVVFLEFEAL